MKNNIKGKIFKTKITFKNGATLYLKLFGIHKDSTIKRFLSQQYFQVKINGQETIYKTEDIFSIEFI